MVWLPRGVTVMDAPERPQRPDRWRRLPERIRPEEMTTTQPTEDARDPDGGRDPGKEWMLRYS
jgi:hypothetical protein